VDALVGDGEHVQVQEVTLPDLVMYFLLRVAPGADVAGRTELDRPLESLHREARLSSEMAGAPARGG